METKYIFKLISVWKTNCINITYVKFKKALLHNLNFVTYNQCHIYGRSNGTFALGPLIRGAHRLLACKINCKPFYHTLGKPNRFGF